MGSREPADPPGGRRRHETVLESVEEVRAQVRGASAPAGPSAATPGDTVAFRPAMRPPMGLLCVQDDGDDRGEMVRIRAGTFVIGRVEGDLVIPHDPGMSARHAEIARRLEDGGYAWSLRDLQSTNGTFVRSASVVLADGQELLIGGRRFRFETTASPPAPVAVPGGPVDATRKWDALPAATVAPASQATLVEVLPQGKEGRRFPLAESETWLGRDPRQCSIAVDDPMVERRHARIHRDERGRWVISGTRSLNGVWARIHEVPLGRGGQFQCGEQRFVFKVL